MKLVVFGLSLSSSWGNGHATTYRALLGAFAARGHEVTFYEWNAPWYGGAHRDLSDPSFARLVFYDDWNTVRARALCEAKAADATLVGSYVREGSRVIDDLSAAAVEPLFFYDIDTPVTVAALRSGGVDYLRLDQIPRFDRYLSFTGGPVLELLERTMGARATAPLYCCVDATSYRPVDADPELSVELAYMGTYAEDRQPAVDTLLLKAARRMPRASFLVAGPQYPETIEWPPNVRLIAHLPPARHAAYYSSARWQLNATRMEMVRAGWSPSVRLFEAGASAAPVISDYWPGIEELFEPGREILLPQNAEDVVEILTDTSEAERSRIGRALQARVLAEHTADRRAEQFERLLAS